MLIIGGSFAGLAAGRDLASHYLVTIIDAKDSMPGAGGVAVSLKEMKYGSCFLGCRPHSFQNLRGQTPLDLL